MYYYPLLCEHWHLGKELFQACIHILFFHTIKINDSQTFW